MSKNGWPPKAKYKTYDPETEGYGDHTAWQEAFHQRMNAGTEADEGRFSVTSGEALYACKTLQELTKVFKEKIKILHPDVAGNTPENISATQKLIAEYNQCRKRLKSNH